MKKEEILELPLGKFSGLRYSKEPYLFLRLMCGKQGNNNFYESSGDVVAVKDIINFSPKTIMDCITSTEAQLDVRSFLKSMKIVREKLLEAGISSEKKYPFLRSPYFVTSNSEKGEWEKFWIGSYELTKSEAKKLTSLLEKVHYSVPDQWHILSSFSKT